MTRRPRADWPNLVAVVFYVSALATLLHWLFFRS